MREYGPFIFICLCLIFILILYGCANDFDQKFAGREQNYYNRIVCKSVIGQRSNQLSESEIKAICVAIFPNSNEAIQ